MSSQTLVRKAAKFAALPAGMATFRRPDDVVVLLYHRIGAGDREIDVDAAVFERQLSVIAEEDTPLTLDQALTEGRGGVVITIDDGYLDFHEIVVPLLVKYGIPATLYLATGLVEGESCDPGDDALTWPQLREAVATGLVTVGAHTHTHADLTHATTEVAEREMWTSKDLIEDQIGVECAHFSYPWSVASSEAEEVAARLYQSAALTWRTNRQRTLAPLRLGRTPILRSDGRVLFQAKMHGLLDGEAYVYRMLRRGPWRER
jgi:peptidoglycan/xylan/chitin deacetylase (PgdA/CDA1 family)